MNLPPDGPAPQATPLTPAPRRRFPWKAILVVLLLLIVAASGSAFLLYHLRARQYIPAAELAPADTLLLAEAPDIARTIIRWNGTSLAILLAEPEVKDFLERPRSTPQWQYWERLGQEVRILPQSAFVAVTSIDGPQPRFIAGFSYDGKRKDLESLLAEPRLQMKRSWPLGRSGLETQGKADIETFTDGDRVVAEAFMDRWYLVGNDLTLVRQVIDRIQAKGNAVGGAARLADDAIYQRSMKALPADSDVRLYLRTGVLAQRFSTLMALAGQSAGGPGATPAWQNAETVAASTKIEGRNFRDTIFALGATGSPLQEEAAPFAQKGAALSSADTLLYYSGFVAAQEATTLPLAQLMQFYPALAAWEKSLAAKGLTMADWSKAYGPEYTVVLDWAESAVQPSALVGLQVRDAKVARDFADALAATASGWARVEAGPSVYYSAPVEGFALVQPVVALSDSFLVAGLSKPAVSAALTRLQNGDQPLQSRPEYQTAAKSVASPSLGFGYFDLRALWDRGYGLMRPILAMSLALDPNSRQVVDAGKLPSTETVSKHLGQSVISQSVTEAGVLVDSTGPLTFNQVIVGAALGAGAAALPTLNQTLQNGVFPMAPPALNPAPAAPRGP